MAAMSVQERDAVVNICHNFLIGSCEYNSNCRFSHDVAAFLKQKPKELPGRCIFSAAPICPYGDFCPDPCPEALSSITISCQFVHLV